MENVVAEVTIISHMQEQINKHTSTNSRDILTMFWASTLYKKALSRLTTVRNYKAVIQ